jgi:hypothetical protein
MQIDLEYDAEKKFLRVLMTGQLDLNEYERGMKDIVNSAAFPPTVSTIWDLRQMDFTELNYKVGEEIAAIRNRFPQRTGARVAFVVNDELGFGKMRMLEAVIGNHEANSNVFYDYIEAQEWLLKNNPSPP